MSRPVLFDLDGLLIDSEPHWFAAEEEVLAAHGSAWSEAVATAHMGMRVLEAVPVMLRAYGISADVPTFARAIVDALLRRFETGLHAMPGAERALALAGPGAALASSSPFPVIRRALSLFGWSFPVVCSGDEVLRGKPAPDIFLLAAERLGVAPEACIVLEDSPNGLRAAKAAGMACIVVPNPASDPSDFGGADLVLASLLDLDPRHLA